MQVRSSKQSGSIKTGGAETNPKSQKSKMTTLSASASGPVNRRKSHKSDISVGKIEVSNDKNVSLDLKTPQAASEVSSKKSNRPERFKEV